MTLTLRVDPDPRSWVAIPVEWPEGTWESADQWAADIAGELLAEPEDSHIVLLRDILASLARSRVDFPADRTFVYVGDLVLPLSTVDIAIFPALDAAEVRHRFLGRADAPGAIGKVQVEEVTTAGLGEGLRVVRFDPEGEGNRRAITATLRYLWRVGDSDVAVNVTFPGPTRLIELLPEVEKLIETISPVDA